jgi:hypothetical protein
MSCGGGLVVHAFVYVQTSPAVLHATPSAFVLSVGQGSALASGLIELQSVFESVVSAGTGVPFERAHANALVVPSHVQVACCVKFPHWQAAMAAIKAVTVVA